jgi:hypothetical protein
MLDATRQGTHRGGDAIPLATIRVGPVSFVRDQIESGTFTGHP